MLRFETFEIHTGFLRVSNLDLAKNLSPNLLAELCGAALRIAYFERDCKIRPADFEITEKLEKLLCFFDISLEYIRRDAAY